MLEVSNPVGAPVPRTLMAAVFRSFRRLHGPARGINVSLVFVDRKTSRRWNRTFRGTDAPTDVLSFPASDRRPWPPAKPKLGEVIICYPVAVQQARASRHGVRREVAELFAHGLAHLAGYDHDTKARAERMATFEAKIITAVYTSTHKSTIK